MSQKFLDIEFDINRGLVDDFFKRVDKPDVCWNWIGSKNNVGYGQIKISTHNYMAHRISYFLRYGHIDEHLTIDHLCKNPSCVNPEHLELVTMRENVMRSDNPCSKNSRKTHCKRGHELSGDNLVEYQDGRRWCKICQTDSSEQFSKKVGRTYYRVANKIHRQKTKKQFELIKSGYCIRSQHPLCKGIIKKLGGQCLCQCH